MAFVRVKDKDTGHEFDVPETDWRIEAGLFTRVSGKDSVVRPRRPKHRVASKGVTSKPSSAAEKKEAKNG
ncbi:hypothetical protein [Glutamicibacter soli]|uniref:hypothetical protein n=1 Tax=Glutamicibacter soli TaxID=453836 RepID=UPI003FD42E33